MARLERRRRRHAVNGTIADPEDHFALHDVSQPNLVTMDDVLDHALGKGGKPLPPRFVYRV